MNYFIWFDRLSLHIRVGSLHISRGLMLKLILSYSVERNEMSRSLTVFGISSSFSLFAKVPFQGFIN